MTTNELDAYGRKTLTGYEAGLLDYYPLNEGEGMWAYDKAPGSMDLSLYGATWKRPVGISMAINGDKGLALWCCGDQIRKGAATNCVEIAELLASK